MKRYFPALALIAALAVPAVSFAEPIPAARTRANLMIATAQMAVPVMQTAHAVLAQAPDAAVVAQGDDLATLANELVTAITSSNWALVAALVIVILTLVLRKWGGQYLPWLNSKWAGVLVPLLGSIAGAVATALIGGAPLTVALLLKAVSVGVMAIGGFSAAKNAGQAAGLLQPAPKPVATTTEAAAVLDRAGRGLGPQP